MIATLAQLFCECSTGHAGKLFLVTRGQSSCMLGVSEVRHSLLVQGIDDGV